MKYRITMTDEKNHWIEWYELIDDEIKTFSTKQEAEEQIAEWIKQDEADGNHYLYSVEEVYDHQYELEIHYLNGEVDSHYFRLTYRFWETDAPTCAEAEEEMRSVDPQTFEALESCENVDYWEVVEV